MINSRRVKGNIEKEILTIKEFTKWKSTSFCGWIAWHKNLTPGLTRVQISAVFSLPYLDWQWEGDGAVLHNFCSSGDFSCSLKFSDWLIRLKPEKHFVWHYQVRVWSWCFHSFFWKGRRGRVQMAMIICFHRTMPSWVEVRPKSDDFQLGFFRWNASQGVEL